MKCYYFFHDWYIIESKEQWRIDEEIKHRKQKVPAPPPDRVTSGIPCYLANKICLKCETHVDEISEYREKKLKHVIAEEKLQAYREKLAMVILAHKQRKQ